MDINNYSYTQYDYDTEVLARYDGFESIVYLERMIKHWASGQCYIVMDLLSDVCEEFDDMASAKAFYNTLVPVTAQVA